MISKLFTLVTLFVFGAQAMRMPMWVNETSICQNGNLCGEKPDAAFEWIADVRSLSLSLSLKEKRFFFRRMMAVENVFVFGVVF